MFLPVLETDTKVYAGMTSSSSTSKIKVSLGPIVVSVKEISDGNILMLF